MRHLAFGLLPDFGSRCPVMRLRIGGVLILIGINAIWNFAAQSKGHGVITSRIVMIYLRGCHDHFSAKRSQSVDLFLAHFIGHREDALIALDRRCQRETHPRIA